MRKVVIVIIIIIVLFFLVFLRIQCTRRNKAGKVQKIAIPVEVMKVEKGVVVKSCEVLGSISARKTAPVFPETMGRITRILVEEGSKVYKNRRLMGIRNETIGFEYEEGFITSPISGTVASIMVDIGSMVNPQMMVAKVVDFSKVKVLFNVSETEVDCIKKKTSVQVRVDGLENGSFKANISEISPVIDPSTKTVKVTAIADNPKRFLKPGMTARVTVNLGEKKDVVFVEKDAYREGFLFVIEDSIAKKRDVKIGIVGDEYIEIVEGLTEGERVIIVGQERLAGDEKVNPIMTDEE